MSYHNYYITTRCIQVNALVEEFETFDKFSNLVKVLRIFKQVLKLLTELKLSTDSENL
jgi:hypothetical protein